MVKISQIVIAKKEDRFVSYETLPIEKYGAVKGEKALSHSFLLDSFRKLMGKTLTIIDASIVGKEHNKAVKDLIRTVFNDEIEYSAQFAFDQVILGKMAEDHFEGKDLSEVEEVSVEEMLGVK